MKSWIGLAVLITLILSSAMIVRGAEQEDKSQSTSTPHQPDTQGTRVTGQLTHIEGWHYTIKDSAGQEVSFGVTSVTKDPDKVKEGDFIVAMVGDDRIALSIKNMKTKKN